MNNMNSNIESPEKDLFWVTSLVSSTTTRLGYLGVALFIGHRSFGFPDYGITPWGLFMFAIAGALAIWITLIVEGWRVDSRLNLGMRATGFPDDGIEHWR